jgi:acetylglutamate kinase
MLCIGYAKSVPDEGFASAERDPSPAFALRRHPLPQGEREDAALCAVAANQIETAPPADHETRFMTDAPYISPLDQARILSEALPHMQRYDEETIVIKYGGHAMGAEDLAKAFARDIVLLEQTAINPVVVHGGGPQIATMLKRLGIESEFAAGLRITDAATIEIVEMVLAGSINKALVGYINEAGGKAVGLCGKDGNMVTASKVTRTMVDPDSQIEKVVDLGFVGEPEKVDLTLLNQLIGYELIPVLAPLATSKTGQTFNVNADTFAGAVAGALKAKRLLLLTDVAGVLDKSKKLIPELSVKDARKLIANGTIAGGMIPKVETCIYALEQGVEGVVIIDGKMQHAVLLELFTNQGTGTLIHK